MNAIFQLLNPDNTISVNRPLAHSIGLTETIIYGALISKWHYYSERGMLDDGWFYSTAADLEESTALTERQQKRCIDNLVALGLIKCEKRCMPAKRGFYIIDNIVILAELIADGQRRMAEIKPQSAAKIGEKIKRREERNRFEVPDETDAQPEEKLEETPAESSAQTSPSHCSDKTSEQVPTKCGNKCGQNVGTCSDKIAEQYSKKSIYNNLNIINPSIAPAREKADDMSDTDRTDRIDLSKQREEYLALLKENISYDAFCEQHPRDKEQIDELLSIMLDVICSTKPTVRANGEEKPHEVVKSVFLKLDERHIEYVMDALQKNTSEVRNIRAYLITALYNASQTIGSYYQTRVNHDLYGGEDNA